MAKNTNFLHDKNDTLSSFFGVFKSAGLTIIIISVSEELHQYVWTVIPDVVTDTASVPLLLLMSLRDWYAQETLVRLQHTQTCRNLTKVDKRERGLFANTAAYTLPRLNFSSLIRLFTREHIGRGEVPGVHVAESLQSSRKQITPALCLLCHMSGALK